MLPGLGHYALVRGDDQQHKIHAHYSRHHVVYELLMPRHVYYAHPVAAGQVEPGKAQVYGDAPALLLLPAVGIAAGERPYEGGLAVVYVSGCAYYYILHILFYPQYPGDLRRDKLCLARLHRAHIH